ncbi:MAG: glycosyltransferase [Opitutae bacterium]|nr:glycosyltransferase [Opitutae bacterium]
MSLDVSVIIPTHNPHPGRLQRTLAGLRAQTLPAARWETVLVDNDSQPPVDPALFAIVAPANLRPVREPHLGLSSARRRGLAETTAPLCVLVDDDNVLAPDYLAHVVRLFAAHPGVGALGGRSAPEFEITPPPWMRQFDDLLACRDLGPAAQISHGLRDPATGRNAYPLCAPIGAGMALRREAAQSWLARADDTLFSDRRGKELSSSGDNEIILTLLQRGWEVGYFPELSLTHLIPAGRTKFAYLARLNRSIQKSWIEVLLGYDASPWPQIAGWTLPLRELKAWFTHRAWSGRAGYIRWKGACGHFQGRVRLTSVFRR